MAQRTCSIDGCIKPHKARGWCLAHYMRWRRLGDPMAPARKMVNGSRLAWLRDVIANREPDDECWEFPFAKSHGYGLVGQNGGADRAHSLALVLSGQRRPPGGYALHSCDNPPCVNPAHLRWGTHVDNMRDAALRGRMRRGERSLLAKLTEAEVRAILLDSRLQKEIADAYGVTSSAIQKIKSGQRWAHVSGGAPSLP